MAAGSSLRLRPAAESECELRKRDFAQSRDMLFIFGGGGREGGMASASFSGGKKL